MKVIIDVNKDTSKLLTDLIDKLNSTKIGDLDKSRSRFESMIKELNDQLADSPQKTELIEFFNEVVDNDEEVITIDKDPNIIDNKTLININTRKMNKKDLIKQELGEIESILKNKAYSQLLAKYQARLFSDVEGLEGEDIQEIKDRLDNISDQLEEISNTEAVTDESVEVTAEESPEETETEEVTEETEETEVPAEESTEESAEESAEETEESTEETEESTEEVKSESEDAEETEETEETEEVVDETEESDPESLVIEKLEKIDEELEELKEAVETKDFSKVIARVHSRLFSEVESHEELIENIDEVKSAMDDLAEKIEKLDAETDEDESDKHEGEEEEVKDAEKAEEESDDAHEESEEETKVESEKCMSCGVTVKFNDGTQHHYDSKEAWDEELDRIKDDKDSAKPVEVIMDKCESDTEEVTDEVVEDTAEEQEVPSTQEVKAVAEQAAEEAVDEYMENGLFMNELDDTMPGDEVTEGTEEAIVSEEAPQKEAEVEPMYIDEKTEMILDPMETEEVVTESEDWSDMEDEDIFIDEDSEQAEYCNKTFSKGSLTKDDDYSNYEVASIDDLLGI